MAVDVFYTSDDGHVLSSNATYATARDGGGTFTVTDPSMSQPYMGQWTGFDVDQYFAEWDTSSIPDTNDVSSAVAGVWVTADNSTQDFTAQLRLYDWGGTVTSADFRTPAQLTAATLLGARASSGIGTGAYQDFSDVAFAANVNKTGATRVVLASDQNAAGTQPSAAAEIRLYAAAGTEPPRLTVTHAPGGQSIYPDADTTTTGWTTTPLWSKIDEASAGGDVITATAA